MDPRQRQRLILKKQLFILFILGLLLVILIG